VVFLLLLSAAVLERDKMSDKNKDLSRSIMILVVVTTGFGYVFSRGFDRIGGFLR